MVSSGNAFEKEENGWLYLKASNKERGNEVKKSPFLTVKIVTRFYRTKLITSKIVLPVLIAHSA
jgi:hypothetical protein